jgi:N-acetylglucosaminyldiphosphoundecaprenol N-acetyl-beta-D-mannosaminyltransferase
MNTAKPNPHYKILGVRVDALTRQAAAHKIVERAADTKQPAVYVIKQYVELMDAAHLNPHNRDLLNNSWLCVPEGVSTQWATAYLYGGRPGWWRALRLGLSVILRPQAVATLVPEKFGGTRFTWELLEAAAQHNLRIYLVGSPKGGDISQTVATIQKRLPKLEIVGSWPGQLENLAGAKLLAALSKRPVERELVTALKTTQPDIVLVGMGFPLQEELIAKLAPQLSHGVLIGEGGTFDYDSFGGRLRKAPQTLQAVGLEWLWRLLLEPKRLRRQLAIPRFVWTVYRTSKKA